jgi:hypothetical protein
VVLQHLILGWCVSQRGLEVVRKILQQICVAYAPEGGTKVGTGSSLSAVSSSSWTRHLLQHAPVLCVCADADQRTGASLQPATQKADTDTARGLLLLLLCVCVAPGGGADSAQQA